MGTRSKAKLGRDRSRWSPMVTSKGRLPGYSRAKWRAFKAQQLNYSKDLEDRCVNMVKDKSNKLKVAKETGDGTAVWLTPKEIANRIRNRRRRVRQGRSLSGDVFTVRA